MNLSLEADLRPITACKVTNSETVINIFFYVRDKAAPSSPPHPRIMKCTAPWNNPNDYKYADKTLWCLITYVAKKKSINRTHRRCRRETTLISLKVVLAFEEKKNNPKVVLKMFVFEVNAKGNEQGFFFFLRKHFLDSVNIIPVSSKKEIDVWVRKGKRIMLRYCWCSANSHSFKAAASK